MAAETAWAKPGAPNQGGGIGYARAAIRDGERQAELGRWLRGLAHGGSSVETGEGCRSLVAEREGADRSGSAYSIRSTKDAT